MVIDPENPKTVLIVEDNELIREGLANVLELEGYRVLTAPNGEEGLELLWENWPDLVVLDLMMPVMDGIEFKKIMDSHPERRSIPVIVFTARPESVPSDMEVSHVLNKSASMDTILDTIDHHLFR